MCEVFTLRDDGRSDAMAWEEACSCNWRFSWRSFLEGAIMKYLTVAIAALLSFALECGAQVAKPGGNNKEPILAPLPDEPLAFKASLPKECPRDLAAEPKA